MTIKPTQIRSFRIAGEEGVCIRGYQDNRGDPYRSGVAVWIGHGDTYEGEAVFLQEEDIDELISNLQAIRNKR
ncbi:UNVERIFIED_ORG: hypothetical protein M2193_000059 [Bradyrhizobium japonicum]